MYVISTGWVKIMRTGEELYGEFKSNQYIPFEPDGELWVFVKGRD